MGARAVELQESRWRYITGASGGMGVVSCGQNESYVYLFGPASRIVRAPSINVQCQSIPFKIV